MSDPKLVLTRNRFRASVPAGSVTPKVWHKKRADSWRHMPRPAEPLEPIVEPEFTPCRHEKCWIMTVHPEHKEDFVRGKVKKPKPDFALRGKKISESRRANQRRGYKEPFKVVRTEQRPNGPMAIVECENCSGAGCDECQHLGELPLFMWWQRRNQRR